MEFHCLQMLSPQQNAIGVYLVYEDLFLSCPGSLNYLESVKALSKRVQQLLPASKAVYQKSAAPKEEKIPTVPSSISRNHTQHHEVGQRQVGKA